MNRTVTQLAARRDQTTTAPNRSPYCCGKRLQGAGPVLWCGGCGTSVPAADIDHDHHAPIGGAA